MNRRKLYKIADEYWRSQLKKSEKAREYLLSRGIIERTWDKYGLGFAPSDGRELFEILLAESSLYAILDSGLFVVDGIRTKANLRYRITFPIVKDGTTESFTARSIDPSNPVRYKHISGWLKWIYNEDLLSYPIVVVTEGPLDALSVSQAGFPSVATFGTSGKRFAEKFDKQRLVYIAYDNDQKEDGTNPGLDHAIKLGVSIRRSHSIPVHIIEIPALEKAGADPNDFLRASENPKKDFAKIVNKAKSINSYPQYWEIVRNLKEQETRKKRRTRNSTTLDDLKAIPIEEVASKYIDELTVTDNAIYCRCPFHEDKNPSMALYLDTNTFICRGASCGKRGDVIQFVQYADGVSFTEACRRLKEGSYGSSED